MDKINKWQKEIEEITSEVEDLLYSKYHAEELEKIIKANNFVKQHIGSFWNHYKLNYTFFIISKIWHQIDKNSDSLSLINLLKDLLNNHKLITKKWWVSQGDFLSTEEFEDKFGEGEYLDPAIISEDIKNLEEAANEIKQFRHKNIGHKDNTGMFPSSISNTKVQEAMNQIETLVKKYQLLLTQSGYDSLTPVADDWQIAFTKPWIIVNER